MPINQLVVALTLRQELRRSRQSKMQSILAWARSVSTKNKKPKPTAKKKKLWLKKLRAKLKFKKKRKKPNKPQRLKWLSLKSQPKKRLTQDVKNKTVPIKVVITIVTTRTDQNKQKIREVGIVRTKWEINEIVTGILRKTKKARTIVIALQNQSQSVSSTNCQKNLSTQKAWLLPKSQNVSNVNPLRLLKNSLWWVWWQHKTNH